MVDALAEKYNNLLRAYFNSQENNFQSTYSQELEEYNEMMMINKILNKEIDNVRKQDVTAIKKKLERKFPDKPTKAFNSHATSNKSHSSAASMNPPLIMPNNAEMFYNLPMLPNSTWDPSKLPAIPTFPFPPIGFDPNSRSERNDEPPVKLPKNADMFINAGRRLDYFGGANKESFNPKKEVIPLGSAKKCEYAVKYLKMESNQVNSSDQKKENLKDYKKRHLSHTVTSKPIEVIEDANEIVHIEPVQCRPNAIVALTRIENDPNAKKFYEAYKAREAVDVEIKIEPSIEPEERATQLRRISVDEPKRAPINYKWQPIDEEDKFLEEIELPPKRKYNRSKLVPTKRRNVARKSSAKKS